MYVPVVMDAIRKNIPLPPYSLSPMLHVNATQVKKMPESYQLINK
jgi:hypothetical protein